MKSTSPSGEEEPAEERSAGFIVYRRSNGRRKYLLLQHRGGGHWAFPKGRIEANEDVLTAARREVEEETGIDGLKPDPRFRAVSEYQFDRRGRDTHKTVLYFLAETKQKAVQLSDEHAEAAWLEADDARQRLTYPESRELLDDVEEYLERTHAA